MPQLPPPSEQLDCNGDRIANRPFLLGKTPVFAGFETGSVDPPLGMIWQLAYSGRHAPALSQEIGLVRWRAQLTADS